MPALVNQTVTIVNKSGKIVSTSKHLVNVFNEAKSAYAERKAEIKAVRKRESEDKDNERRARRQLNALALEEDDDDRRSSVSRRSSRRGSEDGRSRKGSEDGRSRSGRTVKRKPVPSSRPPVERGISDSFYTNDRPRPAHHSSRLRNDVTASLLDDEPRLGELQRRHTDGMQLHRRSPDLRRRKSADSIDMDLAYGDLPPPVPETRLEDELILKEKISTLQRLLDEGNCMQHSVTAIIDNLQKNPDALAAVALTLAEISNIAAKMAPGALAAMKTSFPAVIALLASPQFAIAAGVGVGVTIIAFGGYKIIKKIKAKKLEDSMLLEANPGGVEGEVGDEDQLREISRIERWRRGIADEQVQSVGTSVDGEFLTPGAMGTMIEEGRLTEGDLVPVEVRSEAGKSKKSKAKKAKSRKAGSEVGKGKKTEKEKEGSLLRGLFTGRSERKREGKREREMAFI